MTSKISTKKFKTFKGCEYGATINWEYVYNVTKEQEDSSAIDFHSMVKDKAWEIFLRDVGIYELKHELYTLRKELRVLNKEQLLNTTFSILEEIEKSDEN